MRGAWHQRPCRLEGCVAGDLGSPEDLDPLLAISVLGRLLTDDPRVPTITARLLPAREAGAPAGAADVFPASRAQAGAALRREGEGLDYAEPEGGGDPPRRSIESGAGVGSPVSRYPADLNRPPVLVGARTGAVQQRDATHDPIRRSDGHQGTPGAHRRMVTMPRCDARVGLKHGAGDDMQTGLPVLAHDALPFFPSRRRTSSATGATPGTPRRGRAWSVAIFPKCRPASFMRSLCARSASRARASRARTPCA